MAARLNALRRHRLGASSSFSGVSERALVDVESFHEDNEEDDDDYDDVVGLIDSDSDSDSDSEFEYDLGPEPEFERGLGKEKKKKKEEEENYLVQLRPKSGVTITENGVQSTIVGWRVGAYDEPEYLIQYCRDNNDGVYVYQIVQHQDKNERTLIKSFNKTKANRLPSYGWSECTLHTAYGRFMKIACFQAFAWKGKVSPEHSKAESKNNSYTREFLKGLLCQVKWWHGETTWEAGVAVGNILGDDTLIECVSEAMEKKIKPQWKHVQGCNFSICELNQ